MNEESKERENNNKWDRICKHVDLQSNFGPGGRDLSRMKTAMLNRKADMSQTGGAAAAQDSKSVFF